jgi:hypothetical protein
MIRVTGRFFGGLVFVGLLTGSVLSTVTQSPADPSPRAHNVSCGFVDSTMAFTGTPLEQARCLLRPVLIYGKLGEYLKKLPDPLENLIGQPVGIDKSQLKNFLAIKKIHQIDIGGLLDEPVSKANNNHVNSTPANYFVIHDVSTPNYLDEPFPTNINEATWEWNDLHKRWANKQVAHLFINRLGDSVTAVNFKEPWRATKLEVKVLKEKSKGLFLHIELVQPRRRDSQGNSTNDAIAPKPGFTELQLDRLALVYVAASLRRGMWLIPAFHAGVDAGIPEAHDDPQNFDLTLWAKRLDKLLKEIATQTKP